jgi:pilus assembly protein Flp/PilA
MKAVCNAVSAFWQDESGPTAVEYAVMLAMVIFMCVIIVRQLGTTVSKSFSTADSMLQ